MPYFTAKNIIWNIFNKNNLSNVLIFCIFADQLFYYLQKIRL